MEILRNHYTNQNMHTLIGTKQTQATCFISRGTDKSTDTQTVELWCPLSLVAGLPTSSSCWVIFLPVIGECSMAVGCIATLWTLSVFPVTKR